MFKEFPKGLDDPFSWISITWIITKKVKINGRMKCKEKNRIKVLLSTENPPQIQKVIIWPKYGIAEIKLVITVAPQNDIWPHGKIYPKNAVAINIKIINSPEIQTLTKWNEE